MKLEKAEQIALKAIPANNNLTELAVIKDGRLFSYGRPREVITEKFIKEIYEVDSKVIDYNGRLVVIYN